MRKERDAGVQLSLDYREARRKYQEARNDLNVYQTTAEQALAERNLINKQVDDKTRDNNKLRKRCDLQYDHIDELQERIRELEKEPRHPEVPEE